MNIGFEIFERGAAQVMHNDVAFKFAQVMLFNLFCGNIICTPEFIISVQLAHFMPGFACHNKTKSTNNIAVDIAMLVLNAYNICARFRNKLLYF